MENKIKTVLWIKRIIAVVAIVVWISIIYDISKMQEPFTVQAPYCMSVTMLVFGLLTAIYKGLEYWLHKGVK